MKSDRRVNTAATLHAVYLVWLFLRITTMCNWSVFGLVRGKFPESFAHAQTVDARPLFPPNTWPGYEARIEEEGGREEGGRKRGRREGGMRKEKRERREERERRENGMEWEGGKEEQGSQSVGKKGMKKMMYAYTHY